MTTIKAIYEAGMLRPLEPLKLTEGEQVELMVIENGHKDRHQTEDDGEQPKKTPSEIMDEISALAIDYGEVETSGRDHDKILYGGSESPEADGEQPEKTPAQIMDEISALSIDYGEVDTADVDHDKILYGDVYRKYGA